MKIGVIGSGNIGGTLGRHWAQAGHEVLFSSRHPEKLGELVRASGENAKAVSVTEAFEAKADVYLLAVPFQAIDRLAELYAGEYGGKVIIDATNPYPERDGEVAQTVKESNRNASEYTALKFSTGKTTKAFNTIRAEHLKERAFRDTDRLAIPFAAQDEESRQITKKLIEDIGMDPVFVGDLSATRAMEVDQEVYGLSTDRSSMVQTLKL